MTRILLLVTTTLTLAACNTIQGAGEDIESAGEGVQDVAVEAENDMTM